MGVQKLRLRLSRLPGVNGPLEGCRIYFNDLILTENQELYGKIESQAKIISLEEWNDYRYRVEAPTRIEENLAQDTPMPTAADMCALARWAKEQAESIGMNAPLIAWLQSCPLVSEERDIVVPIYDERELLDPLILCPNCKRGRIKRFSLSMYDCDCEDCCSKFFEKPPPEREL